MLNFEGFIKKYIIWGYFLCYPLINAFIPNINLGVVQLSPFRIFLIIPITYLVLLFFNNKGSLKISRENSYLFFYVIFSIFNNWRQDHFVISNVINYSFPFLLLLCFDNLSFLEEDLKRFYRMISVLAIIVFIASFIQNYIQPSFYVGIRGVRWLERYMYGGDHFRHASIFRSIGFYQAGVAIGVLCLIFLFLNYKKLNFKYLVLFVLMVLSTFFTYTRSNWIIPLIGIGWFVLFKPFKQKVLIVSGGLIILMTLYVSLFSQLEQSNLYRDRVISNTYEGRFESIEVYMKHFFGRNMLLGFGIDSGYSDLFREYGRPEAHNGYLEVLFRNGLLGVFLFFGFWYYILKKGIIVYKISGNGIFIAFISVFATINMVYKFISISHYGYHMLIFYLYMTYRLLYKNEEKQNTNENLNNHIDF